MNVTYQRTGQRGTVSPIVNYYFEDDDNRITIPDDLLQELAESINFESKLPSRISLEYRGHRPTPEPSPRPVSSRKTRAGSPLLRKARPLRNNDKEHVLWSQFEQLKVQEKIRLPTKVKRVPFHHNNVHKATSLSSLCGRHQRRLFPHPNSPFNNLGKSMLVSGEHDYDNSVIDGSISHSPPEAETVVHQANTKPSLPRPKHKNKKNNTRSSLYDAELPSVAGSSCTLYYKYKARDDDATDAQPPKLRIESSKPFLDCTKYVPNVLESISSESELTSKNKGRHQTIVKYFPPVEPDRMPLPDIGDTSSDTDEYVRSWLKTGPVSFKMNDVV